MRSTYSAMLVLAVTFAAAPVRAEEEAPPAAKQMPETAVESPPMETRPKSDATTEAAVGRALADDRQINAMQIKVAVLDGVVTLTGKTNSADEKRSAESI